MKRICLILLMSSMALALCACGTKPIPSVSETTALPEPTPAAILEPTPQPVDISETPAPTPVCVMPLEERLTYKGGAAMVNTFEPKGEMVVLSLEMMDAAFQTAKNDPDSAYHILIVETAILWPGDLIVPPNVMLRIDFGGTLELAPGAVFANYGATFIESGGTLTIGRDGILNCGMHTPLTQEGDKVLQPGIWVAKYGALRLAAGARLTAEETGTGTALLSIYEGAELHFADGPDQTVENPGIGWYIELRQNALTAQKEWENSPFVKVEENPCRLYLMLETAEEFAAAAELSQRFSGRIVASNLQPITLPAGELVVFSGDTALWVNGELRLQEGAELHLLEGVSLSMGSSRSALILEKDAGFFADDAILDLERGNGIMASGDSCISPGVREAWAHRMVVE